MAKDKRFPSPANVAVDKNGKPSVAIEKKEELKPAVVGKKVKLVGVKHSGDQHVILPNSVHALAPGHNWVDESVISNAVKHPHIASLVSKGVIEIEKTLDEVPAAEEQ